MKTRVKDKVNVEVKVKLKVRVRVKVRVKLMLKYNLWNLTRQVLKTKRRMQLFGLKCVCTWSFNI